MKTLILTIFLFITGLNLFADEKAPVAMNDYSQASTWQTVAIRVLDNDFAYDGHPFRIQMVFGSPNGVMSYNDSLVFYTPKTFFQGVDSLRYRIVDLQNNLMSPIAKIYIEVMNNGITFLDLNQVKCRILAGGMQFFDGQNSGIYEVPAGSGLNTIFSKTFWIGGLDDNEVLHLAGERYRMVGADYFTGPKSDSIHYTTEYNIGWHKVWKLTKAEIAHHRANWQEPDYEPIENIRDWPGNGNPMLGQAALLAPYYDWNSDGTYNPLQGDFPLIKGDQAILTIFNDDRVHTESSGKKLGIEIQAMYYVYDQPGDLALSQTVFCSMNILNRSPINYHDVYAAYFVDFDLGYFWDDFIGCDTITHSAFAYNASATDGNGGTGTYGNYPPAQSFTCLNFEMDGFIYFNNTSPAPMTDPQVALEYYHYMKSFWRDGSPLTYGADGYGGETPVKFAYPGDPVAGDGWTESMAGSTPGDRRGLISTGPFTFLSGDSLKLDFALVFARDYEGDNLSSVALLKERIQEIRDFYVESLDVVEVKPETISFKVFPNPFQDALVVETILRHETITWTVYDLMGKAVADGRQFNEPSFGINLKSLNKGIYFLSLKNGKSLITKKIIKL